MKDPYAAIMKGVILGFAPHAVIIDVSHEIEPQDVREAVFLIEEYYRYFPAGTVHVAVVDPTVGSDRKPIILHRDGSFFVGPDNGIFSLVMPENPEVHVIENTEMMLTDVSTTFHGRDIFAPAAARLVKGISPDAFGKTIKNPVRLAGLTPTIDGDALQGKIVRLDHFGNAISNIKFDTFYGFHRNRPFLVTLGSHIFRSLNNSYFESEYTCLVGSSGYLEFGMFKGNFSAREGIRKGTPVLVTI